MEIRKDLATVRIGENCFGTQNKKKFLVIHQTGNQRKGADAQMHAKYQKGRIGEVSWHWQVDDKEAIQSFEHDVQCYHASDGLGDGNLNSIAIEGCINVDGDYKKTVDNMARLAAKILKDENISITNMKQHYDFARDKKNCPQQIREGKESINWSAFVSLVQGYINEPIVAGAKVEKPKTDKQLADEVIKGIHGTGAERKAKLGSRYDAVQKLVDEMFKPKPVAKPVVKPVAKPVSKKTYVQLAKHEPTWRAYRLGTQPVAGNEVGFLAPRQYGGLEYEVLGYENNGTCAIIQTQAFGKVKIFIKDPSAKIVTR